MHGEAFGGDSSSMTEAEVQTFVASEGRAYGKSAYMLVYERKQKTPIRIVDISRNSEKQEESEKDVKEEGNQDEKVSTIPWNKIPAEVPDWI
jgi:hypothetical protein